MKMPEIPKERDPIIIAKQEKELNVHKKAQNLKADG